MAMARELERRCFKLGLPLGRGQKLFHGWVHIFPEFKGRMPTALRALHTWEDLGASSEGGPACRESIHVMAEEMIKRGYVDSALAAETALDGYMREQDWGQLRAEDVKVDWHKDGTCSTALLFGRRHRGESVKTGQEQGVKLESPLLCRLLAERAASLQPSDKVFEVTPETFRRHWREVAEALGMSWFPPPHCLRHTGPSEDAFSGRRTLEDIRRRGRWSQIKSVQRYAKPHALVSHRAQLDPAVKARGSWLEENFSSMLKCSIEKSSPWRELVERIDRGRGTRHPWLLR